MTTLQKAIIATSLIAVTTLGAIFVHGQSSDEECAEFIDAINDEKHEFAVFVLSECISGWNRDVVENIIHREHGFYGGMQNHSWATDGAEYVEKAMGASLDDFILEPDSFIAKYGSAEPFMAKYDNLINPQTLVEAIDRWNWYANAMKEMDQEDRYMVKNHYNPAINFQLNSFSEAIDKFVEIETAIDNRANALIAAEPAATGGN